MADPMYDRLEDCYSSVEGKIPSKPKVALVSGSGLGDYTEQLEIQGTIDYRDIEEFPVFAVPGRKSRFVLARINGVPTVLIQGRIHYYEGYSMLGAVLSVHPVKFMGAEILFLTDAAGEANYDYEARDFMLIKNQISCFVPLPLIGLSLEELGPKSPDMDHIYDEDLGNIIRSTILELGVRIQGGVYVRLIGSIHESPYEMRICGILGGDAAGTSTARETVTANRISMKICGVSCISNLTCGMVDMPLSHQEVQGASSKVAPLFKEPVSEPVEKMEDVQTSMKNQKKRRSKIVFFVIICSVGGGERNMLPVPTYHMTQHDLEKRRLL